MNKFKLPINIFGFNCIFISEELSTIRLIRADVDLLPIQYFSLDLTDRLISIYGSNAIIEIPDPIFGPKKSSMGILIPKDNAFKIPSTATGYQAIRMLPDSIQIYHSNLFLIEITRRNARRSIMVIEAKEHHLGAISYGIVYYPM